jgi:hypothetical protein
VALREHLLEQSSWAAAVLAFVITIVALRTASRGARNDVLAQVREWGNDVVDLLADARRQCQHLNSSDFVRERAKLRAHTSALLDRGRFFFPNLPAQLVKEGLRPPILDLLIIAYELIPGISEEKGANNRREKAFHYLQAVFVSSVKEAVNFRCSPTSVKSYERYLTSIEVQTFPPEICELMAEKHAMQIRWDRSRSLDKIPERDAPQGHWNCFAKRWSLYRWFPRHRLKPGDRQYRKLPHQLA